MAEVSGFVLRVLLAAALAILGAQAGAACRGAPHSNFGCDFYAVTLRNAYTDTATYAFGIRALNPSAMSAATLQVSGGGLASPQDQPLAAGAAGHFTLPWVDAMVTATGTALFAGAAYHVVSDQPVSIAQFNSDDPASFSNDATLLLPVRGGDTSYYVNAWPEWNFDFFNEPAQVAVVATSDGTTVQVTGHDLQPGAGLTANGGSVSMDAGDVLLLSSALSAFVDISGTRIDADAPLVVFSAHAGTYVPGNVPFADHLEDVLPSQSELAQDYVFVRPSDPSGASAPKQMVKLVASVDGTTLTFDPAVPGAPSILDAGQATTFEATVDTYLHAGHPIVAMQFMEGNQAFAQNVASRGDPSQLASVAVNRGALEADFVAPTTFAPIFAQVVAPSGATVLIDGDAVTGWSAVGGSGYSSANVGLCCTDKHHAAGNRPFTLSVYAYPGSTTSYWYAAQLGPRDDIFGDGFE
jgi:hypothetical protein